MPAVVGPTIQAIGMGTDLLTRISVGQRKATEGVHMELRETSDSPRSEKNKKDHREEIQRRLDRSGESQG